MKSTGMVRKIDQLGRVVLPKELRQTLDIQTNDSMEIFIEGTKMVLRKYESGCIFCGETQHVRTVKGKLMCQKCLDAIKNNT